MYRADVWGWVSFIGSILAQAIPPITNAPTGLPIDLSTMTATGLLGAYALLVTTKTLPGKDAAIEAKDVMYQKLLAEKDLLHRQEMAEKDKAHREEMNAAWAAHHAATEKILGYGIQVTQGLDRLTTVLEKRA